MDDSPLGRDREELAAKGRPTLIQELPGSGAVKTRAVQKEDEGEVPDCAPEFLKEITSEPGLEEPCFIVFSCVA